MARLAGGQAVEHGVGDQVAVELDGAGGVVVARDRIGDAVRIAVGVEDRDDRDVQLAGFLDRDRFLVGVDHEHQVGHAAHVLDAAQRQLQLVALAGQLQQLLLGAALRRRRRARLRARAGARSSSEMVRQLVSVPPSQRWLT